MDILIVGKYGVVTDALINKLNKEGNNIFVLMGEGYHSGKHKYVYGHYSFDYSSDSIRDVISSVKPACIIYTGAYDNEFSWERPNRDALRFVSAAMNIAMTAATLNVPRFICLSSNDVFEDSAFSALNEDADITAASSKGIAVAQMEKVCLGCGSRDGMKVVILRLDNLYGVPFEAKDVHSRCSKLCLDALNDGVVKVNENDVRTHLHLNDASQAVLNVVNAKHIEHSIYHVTDAQEVSGLEIGKILSESNEIAINDDTGTDKMKIVLDGSRFNKEFSFRVFNRINDAVPYIYAYMKKHENRFIPIEEKKGGFLQSVRRVWKAMRPYVESAVCAALIGLVHYKFGSSVYLQRVDIFLIYTIIFGIIYGKTLGIFSAFAGIAAYYISSFVSGTGKFNAAAFVWIAVMFIVGMAVGHLKDLITTSTQDKDDEIEYLSGRLSDVNSINSSNMHIKDVLKSQIISYDNSLATLYSAASELDKANPINVMFYAAQMLENLLGAKDVAIYHAVRGGFARLVTATSRDGKKLGVSYDFEKNADIFEALEKRRVFVNSKLNPNQPMMVSALYSGERIDNIIVIWSLRYEQMTLHETDMLTVLGYMIQDSVARSNRYIDSVENRKYEGCERTLVYPAFLEMEQVYRNAFKIGLAESTVIKVEKPKESVAELDKKLSRYVRESDFLGADKNDDVFILLSSASEQDAQIVINRMESNGITCSVCDKNYFVENEGKD